jgi:hypothetical protein
LGGGLQEDFINKVTQWLSVTTTGRFRGEAALSGPKGTMSMEYRENTSSRATTKKYSFF